MSADPFYYARDHKRGAGAWCVRGPHGFEIAIDDKACAFMLGKLLSGHVDEATSMALDFVTMIGRKAGSP